MKNPSLVLCLAAFPLVAACHKEEFVPAHRIDIPQKIVKMDGKEGHMPIRFATNAEKWTVTSDKPWVHADPSSGGKGTTPITITADDNPGDTSRYATLYFTTDQITETRPVIQRVKDCVTLTPNVIRVGWEGTPNSPIYVRIETKEIEIHELRAPELSPYFMLTGYNHWWIQYTISDELLQLPRGEGYQFFVPGHSYNWPITVSSNPYTIPRALYFKIYEVDGSTGAGLSIIQDGKPEELL